jgi:hypothetical protein
VCHGGRVERGSAACLTLGGLRVDCAVAAAVLDAIQPVGITAALEALEPGGAAHDTTRQAVTLALEKARYDAQRAWRQYARVDPEHRLVAGELAHRWNAARERVTEVEAQLATLQSQQSARSEEPRQGVRTLGQALRVVWQHPSVSEALKKRLLRTVLHDITINTPPEPPEPILHLHWHGGGTPRCGSRAIRRGSMAGRPRPIALQSSASSRRSVAICPLQPPSIAWAIARGRGRPGEHTASPVSGIRIACRICHRAQTG